MKGGLRNIGRVILLLLALMHVGLVSPYLFFKRAWYILPAPWPDREYPAEKPVVLSLAAFSPERQILPRR
jgi:hypothetical protein